MERSVCDDVSFIYYSRVCPQNIRQASRQAAMDFRGLYIFLIAIFVTSPIDLAQICAVSRGYA